MFLWPIEPTRAASREIQNSARPAGIVCPLRFDSVASPSRKTREDTVYFAFVFYVSIVCVYDEVFDVAFNFNNATV